MLATVIDERPVWVTIPTIGYSPHLIPLINELERDRAIDKIILTVNLEEYVEPIQEFFEFGGPTIEVLETWPLGKSLYHGWNTAIEMARQANAFLAVFNDDIRLLDLNSVSRISGLLSENPTYAIAGLNWQESPENTSPGAKPLRQVTGSYRNLGVGGFAWVCDPHKVELVPDDFVWWFGDDHIFISAEKDGHLLGIANHIHVEHADSTTSGTQEWINEAVNKDIDAFRRIWPGR
jgi:hypothetical protein